MRRVLVVCTANQCRSPMAEGLIRERIRREGRTDALGVVSAGTWVSEGRPATRHAVTAMARRGIDIEAHRSQEITSGLLGAADLVLVMTDGHRQALEADFPESRGKVSLMSSLAGCRYDIADPIGGGIEDYLATAAELDRLIEAGWEAIVGDG